MAKLGKDPELNALMKKVNKRITVLERSYNVIYQNQTDALIDRMRRTAEHLTGVSGKTIRKGDLRPEDVNKYKRAMRSFLESDMSTITGQNRIMIKAKEAYEKEYGKISEEDYKTLTSIMESDEFSMFKEKFGMYGNILKDMTSDVKSYSQATEYLKAYTEGDTKTMKALLENNEAFQEKLNNRKGQYSFEKFLDNLTYADGSVNVTNFIDGWNALR